MGSNEKSYTSPKHKLLAFFQRSRDKWKAKSIAATAKIKALKNRIRFLEQSKQALKEKADERKAEITELKARLEEAVQKLAEAEAREKDEQPEQSGRVALCEQRLPRHHYFLGEIFWFISLTLSAAVSLRGSGAAMEVSNSVLGLGLAIPTWSSGRLWLLRLGYYKLTRPKEKAEDWVWIVDHHVESGRGKCLIILGVRLSDLPPPGQCLRHEDLEPIELFPVETSNGGIVYQQLNKAKRKTGVPRVIVGDHGSDLQKGIEDFCAKNPRTSYVYDVKHRTAKAIEKVLENDDRWREFRQRVTATKQQTQQTEVAHLAPPSQRTKARYMNIDTSIVWGVRVLGILDRLEGRGKKNGRLREKLGWVMDYREELAAWEGLLTTVKKVEAFVRENGLTRGCEDALARTIPVSGLRPCALQVREELLEFVREESSKAAEGERLPGSSEVIESVIGKLKRIEGETRGRGISSLILAAGAIVAETTAEVVRKALTKVRTTNVRTWCRKRLGETLQSKRRAAFSTAKA